MKRDTLIVGGLLAVAAGCTAFPGLPSQLQPPTSGVQAQDQKADPALMDVTIRLNIGGADRAVQFNGGSGALLNDINNLIVGLFDNGSGSSFVASLGYLYPGAVGSAGTATTVSTTTAPYITDLYTSRLGTNGTLGTSCSCTISTDKSNMRRYLVRDYGTATAFSSASTTAVFTKVPAGGTAGHTYVIFAAAYDSAANNLGYGEAALSDSVTAAGAASSTAATITLNLKNNVFTNNLSQAPTLTTFVPSATLRSLLP